MNYIYILVEVIFIFFLMILFYKLGKKDGLFNYIFFMSSLLGVVTVKSIDILSFEVDLGVPVLMSLFACNNIIIQRYGMDEMKKIIKSFVFPYIFTFIILYLTTLIGSSEYNLITNNAFNNLFGYNLENLRLIISCLLAGVITLCYNSYIYTYIRKNKNKYLFSNIGSMLIIQFFESIIFVLVAYVGIFDINVLFGMIVIRYLLKVMIGFISLIPIRIILKIK